MSREGKDVMLLSGKSGGKTTFLGAFAMQMSRNNIKNARGDSIIGSVYDLLGIKTGLTGDYEVVKGDDDIFKGSNDSVLNRMKSQMYPEGTLQRDNYILEFRINSDLKDTATITFTVMDIPGEVQAMKKIRDNNYSAGDVLMTYENDGIQNRPSVQNLIENDNQSPNRDEWKNAFLYEYIQSDNVIIMVNLHKILKQQSLDFTIDKKLIEMVSKSRRCLLLFTAVDVVDYDPSGFRVGSLTGGGIQAQNFDTDLLHKLDHENPQSSITRDASSDVLPLVRKAQQEGVDMFGVSVPAVSNDRIKEENGRTVLKGIDNVGKWLKQN